MKKVLFILSFFLLQLPGMAQPIAINGKIQVTINGIRNNKGRILCSLFREGEGYPDQPTKAYYRMALPIKNGTAMQVVESVPPGRYAFAVLHDENGDEKMNTTFIGLPKEGYGFSNNVMGLMGPPTFSKSSFTVVAGQQKNLPISLRY